MLNQFIGYLFTHPTLLVNFYAGFNFMQAFTKSIRGYNYDMLEYDNALRQDFSMGIKLGWIIPIYQNNKAKQYYFD